MNIQTIQEVVYNSPVLAFATSLNPNEAGRHFGEPDAVMFNTESGWLFVDYVSDLLEV